MQCLQNARIATDTHNTYAALFMIRGRGGVVNRSGSLPMSLLLMGASFENELWQSHFLLASYWAQELAQRRHSLTVLASAA